MPPPSLPDSNIEMLTRPLARVACDTATRMHHTGIDPFAAQEVIVSEGLRDRKVQRALLQFFKSADKVSHERKGRPEAETPDDVRLRRSHSPDAESRAESPSEAQTTPSANAPLLTAEADEMTEFVAKAIPAKDLATRTGKT